MIVGSPRTYVDPFALVWLGLGHMSATTAWISVISISVKRVFTCCL